MQTNSIVTLSDFNSSWKDNDKYFNMLALMASLSNLFSENPIPYLDYRLAENLFCRYYDAINDARSCTAYDAHFNSLGIGIKTFILSNKDDSVEKVAEFNKMRPELDNLKELDLARKLGELRNERISLTNRLYNINETQYHIVGRKEGLLRIFNHSYDCVIIDSISDVKETKAGIHFNDGVNEYLFNKSKSVLQMRFVAKDYKDISVKILQDPISLLESLLSNDSFTKQPKPLQKGIDYVVLPLYSTKNNSVPEKSGINQWNAGGRPRSANEIYIPVPRYIHKNWSDFFPQRDKSFLLSLPNNSTLSAKICQDGGKALMSNPNSALGEWLLRNVLKKKEGELVTMNDLNTLGIDSVVIYNEHRETDEGLKVYRIEFSDKYEGYKGFSGEE